MPDLHAAIEALLHGDVKMLPAGVAEALRAVLPPLVFTIKRCHSHVPFIGAVLLDQALDAPLRHVLSSGSGVDMLLCMQEACVMSTCQAPAAEDRHHAVCSTEAEGTVLEVSAAGLRAWLPGWAANTEDIKPQGSCPCCG